MLGIPEIKNLPTSLHGKPKTTGEFCVVFKRANMKSEPTPMMPLREHGAGIYDIEQQNRIRLESGTRLLEQVFHLLIFQVVAELGHPEVIERTIREFIFSEHGGVNECR